MSFLFEHPERTIEVIEVDDFRIMTTERCKWRDGTKSGWEEEQVVLDRKELAEIAGKYPVKPKEATCPKRSEGSSPSSPKTGQRRKRIK